MARQKRDRPLPKKKGMSFVGLPLTGERVDVLLDLYEHKNITLRSDLAGLKNVLDLVWFTKRIKARTRAIQWLIGEDMMTPSLTITKRGSAWVENYTEKMRCVSCNAILRGVYLSISSEEKFCDAQCRTLYAIQDEPPEPFPI